jgi:hypothetical protein
VQDEYDELVSEKVIAAKPNLAWKETLAYLLAYLEGSELENLVH